MFSSKIIKSSTVDRGHLSTVTFEKLTGEPRQERADVGLGGFTIRPLGIGGFEATPHPADSGWKGSPTEQPVPEEETTPALIHEEEAALRERVAYDEGYREGSQHAEERLTNVSEALSKALHTAGGLREEILNDCEDDLLKLAVMIAGKIIRQEIEVDRRILATFVKSAISRVAEDDEVVVRLNPSDYVVVTDNRLLSSPQGGKRRMTLKADETVACGGCMVDTAMGSLDARLEAQLEEIYRRLLEERNTQRSHMDSSGRDEVEDAFSHD